MLSIRSFLMAKFYDASMRKTEKRCLGSWRKELLGNLAGEVLEIGSGTGVNLSYYPHNLQRLVLSEPEPNMRRQLQEKVDRQGAQQVKVVGCGAENLPFSEASFDIVVSTLVLCSVTSPEQTLAQIWRVLRPGGKLVVLEHVGAENDPRLARWQRRLEPLWKYLGGNCHLTRLTAHLVERAGFAPELERAIMIGAPPVVRPVIKGMARKSP